MSDEERGQRNDREGNFVLVKRKKEIGKDHLVHYKKIIIEES